jgi:glycosyltransferase involved in cell wall biosynthesis
MKIGVVTPVYQTPRPWLSQCLAGVRAQTVPCTHFLVNDGDDSLCATDFPEAEFLQLPRPHADNGNAARAVGSVSAIARGFDAIAYLDADNWFETDHLQRLVELHQRTGAAVCTAARNLVDLEGRLLGRCPEVDGEKFADTSSLFFTRAAFGLVAVWYRMPHALTPICDRVVWKAVLEGGYSRAHSNAATVNFRTGYRAHYTHFGKTPPSGSKHVHTKMTRSGEFVSAEMRREKETGDRRQETGGKCENTDALGAGLLTPSPNAGGVRRLAPSAGKCENMLLGSDSPLLSPVSCLLSPLLTPHSSLLTSVSLCMIVKNEEANLPECLGPVGDLVDEIVVVDTGSTDGTKECARRLGAKVHDFAWVDSFAAARNESLRHATGKWILWLDGDERLDEANLQKLARLLKELPDENNVYMMCQCSAPDPLTGSTLVVDQARLFRNLPKVRWTHRVHEQIFLALKEQGAREVRTDIVISHLGYQDPELRRRKRERNIRLLLREVEETPEEAFVHFNLANAYMDGGQVEKALPVMRRCLELAPARASYIPKVYFLLAGGCHLLGRDEEALGYCREGKKQFPWAAGLWFHEGILLLARGDLAGARRAFETILELPAQGNYVATDAILAGCRTRHNLAFVYRRLGLAAKAEEQWLLALNQTPEFEPAWLALVELYLEHKRHQEAEALLLRLEGKPYEGAIRPALEARLRLARRDLPGALRILEEALARTPQALWLRIVLSDILLRVASDDSAAERQLRAILAMSPNEQQSRRNLAQLLGRKGR